jgi:hypothetical protein
MVALLVATDAAAETPPLPLLASALIAALVSAACASVV